MKTRIGFGYDVHRLENGVDFWIGGIKILHSKGAVGHSDADVLIHAICDAFLGAANLGDIGQHFPDTDHKFKGIDSKILLRKVVALIREKGFSIGNIDCTICLEKPKLVKYINDMKDCLANCIGIPIFDISIKATTSEKMGFVGNQDGITAYSVVLIYSD